MAGFDGWPEDQRTTLSAYCNALWDYALSDYPIKNILPSFPSIDDCLCSIAQVVDDVTPLLDRWNSARDIAAIRHLVDFADENVSALKEIRKLSNSFWENRSAQMQQVVDWFFKQDFAMPLEIATQSIHPWELRNEVKREIFKRSLAQHKELHSVTSLGAFWRELQSTYDYSSSFSPRFPDAPAPPTRR